MDVQIVFLVRDVLGGLAALPVFGAGRAPSLSDVERRPRRVGEVAEGQVGGGGAKI